MAILGWRCGAVAVALLASVAVAGAAEERVVTVADHDWPPFMFGGKPGQPKGLVKELLELCLPAAGYRPDFRDLPIRRAFAYLQEGRLDVNVMSVSVERQAYALYGSVPLFTSSYRPVVRASSQVEVRSAPDLDPLRLGHLAGLAYSPEFLAYVEGRLEAGTAVTATSQEALLRMLLAGRLDVFVIPRESLVWRARAMGVADRVRVLPYDVRTSDYYVAVARRSARVADPPAFLAAVDACIAETRRDGRHRAILARYGLD